MKHVVDDGAVVYEVTYKALSAEQYIEYQRLLLKHAEEHGEIGEGMTVADLNIRTASLIAERAKLLIEAVVVEGKKLAEAPFHVMVDAVQNYSPFRSRKSE